jgi:hypothetical protein
MLEDSLGRAHDAGMQCIPVGYFGYSGWLLSPTPAPKLTPTHYPLLQWKPLPTKTPEPTATRTP